MKRYIPLFLALLPMAIYGQTATSIETGSVFDLPNNNTVSADSPIFTGGYTHFSGDTNSGQHATLDTNLVWNPLSGNTVTSAQDLTGSVSGGSLSYTFIFADGTSAHVVATFALTPPPTIPKTPGGTGGTGSKTGYAHLTVNMMSGKHLTVDGNVIWNPLSGNTVTTAADMLSGFKPGGSLSSVLTFANNGGSVQLVSTFSSVTVTPSFFIGANVETGNVCPSDPHYVKTNDGDLFDLARQADWNTLRLTQYETWGHSEMDKPYTAQNWADVFTRAKATGMYLIVTLEMSAAERTAVSSAPAGQAAETVRVTYDEQSVDTILGSLPSTQRGQVAIDLGNEEKEDNPQYSQLDVYTKEAGYIRSKYPGVSITVGGWQLNGKFNQAPDGAPYVPIEDFISAHIYATSVVNFLNTVNTWSNGKPIMMEEYGSSSGLLQKPACATCSPEKQAAVNTASLQGLLQAKQSGINAIGALVWSYFPRGTLTFDYGGGNYQLNGNDNQFVVLVPDGFGGAGLPINTLPAAQAVCPPTVTCPSFPNSLVQQ